MLYVADVTQAAAAAGLARREPGTFGARITLIPFDGICELGRVQIGGDLGVTPGLVGHLPGIETLLLGAGYQHRTTARPGLWGRTPYVDRLGGQQFREKIDLLAPHGLSGTASRARRGVPALRSHHGKLAIGNVLGLELAAFNRSPMTITDFADPLLSTPARSPPSMSITPTPESASARPPSGPTV